MNLPKATTKIKLKRTEICIFAAPLQMNCREKARSYCNYENRLLHRFFRFFSRWRQLKVWACLITWARLARLTGLQLWYSHVFFTRKLKTWINYWRHQMSSAKYVWSQWWWISCWPKLVLQWVSKLLTCLSTLSDEFKTFSRRNFEGSYTINMFGRSDGEPAADRNSFCNGCQNY